MWVGVQRYVELLCKSRSSFTQLFWSFVMCMGIGERVVVVRGMEGVQRYVE